MKWTCENCGHKWQTPAILFPPRCPGCGIEPADRITSMWSAIIKNKESAMDKRDLQQQFIQVQRETEDRLAARITALEAQQAALVALVREILAPCFWYEYDSENEVSRCIYCLGCNPERFGDRDGVIHEPICIITRAGDVLAKLEATEGGVE